MNAYEILSNLPRLALVKPAPLDPPRGTALVVEDEPLMRERVRQWLAEAKFEVKCASEYASGLRALELGGLAIAFVDMSLPRESGLDLVEAIRQHSLGKHLPIVVMSERHSPEDMAEAERVGANAFLKKPFARPLLLKYAQWILEGPRATSPSIRDLQIL
jgi:DNA-binding response OmpR family regulator